MVEEYANKFCGSQLWDEYRTWYTKSPRFTECFENTVLVYIPCILLWAFAGVDIYWNRARKANTIPLNWRYKYKIIFVILLFVIRLMDFTLEIITKKNVFPVDITTPLIQMITLILCFHLVCLHRYYGQRSSSLMFLYWFLVVLFEFPRFFSSFEIRIHVHEFFTIAAYTFSYFMFILTWIPDLPPESSTDERLKLQNPSPEESAPFVSYMTFYWFNELMSKGYKMPLKICDLWSVDYENSARCVSSLFNKYWDALANTKNSLIFKTSVAYVRNDERVEISGCESEDNRSSIVPPLCRAFWPAFVPCSIFKILQVLFSFVSPLILKCLILFMEDNDEPQWHGYFYASLLLVFSLLLMFSTSQYIKLSQIIGLRIKTALIIAIYRKTLKLSNSSKEKATIGDIATLIAVDAQRFSNLIKSLCKLWAFPLQLILATTLLWQILGPSALVGLSILIFMVPINRYFAKKTKVLQTEQMKYHDRRIKIMNEVVSGIKMLKLYAWETKFQKKILRIRRKEATLLKKGAYLKAFVGFIWASVPFMVSLVTFATYVLIDENNILDTSKAFVSLALFNIIRLPLVSLPHIYNSIMHAGVSINRLDDFLNLEEFDPDIVTHLRKDDEGSILMKNCFFTWIFNEPSTLRNICLQVNPGSLIAVVGSVGCGKSSLISALLGEMYKKYGEVTIKGSVAYVPQQAWIQNSTLQQNILFGEKMDIEKYNRVIDLCALRQDLEILPEGDDTQIGEWEIKLSGGLKQRISLARALYSDRDIYFFDSPLCAVDSDVRSDIFEEVISSRGILKEKTRLYVSHSVDYLSEADLIVVLDNGEISEIGRYHDLIDRKGPFSEFLIEYGFEIDTENLGAGDGHLSIAGPSREKSPIRPNPVSSDEIKETPGPSSELNPSSRSLVREEIGIGRLVNVEKHEVGNMKWKFYADYLKAIGLRMVSSAIFFLILHQCFSVGSNLWLSEWSSDKSILINGAQDISKRKMYLGIYGLFGFAETVSSFFFSMLWYIGATEAGTVFHYLLLVNIMHCPLAFFETTQQGRIVGRFSKDIDILDNVIPVNGKQLLTVLAAEAGTVLLISYLTPIFLIAIIPVGILYYFIQKYYVTTSRQLKKLESYAKGPLYSHFGACISGTSTIRAYGAEKRLLELTETIVDYNQSCTYSSIIATRWLAIRLQGLGNLIVFFCALLSVIQKDSLSPGIVALSITYALKMNQTLTLLINSCSDVENNIVAVERIKEYAEIPQEADWETPPDLVTDDWPKNGKIEFIDYSMRYRDELDLALIGINLSINSGEKIGIVGRAGAGKSSVAHGLFRLVEPAGGKIMIDDVDISKLGLHSLRSHLTIIPQNPILFSGSLKMNIDPFNHHSEDEIWDAIEAAELSTFVPGLNSGLEHIITEGGYNISVGQRQLICLCRAILQNSKILVLDEATAAIDPKTYELIEKTIKTAFADCTVLTIAHRIKTIYKSDRVLVLERGRVVEFDKPKILLKNKSSAFYRIATHDSREAQ